MLAGWSVLFDAAATSQTITALISLARPDLHVTDNTFLLARAVTLTPITITLTPITITEYMFDSLLTWIGIVQPQTPCKPQLVILCKYADCVVLNYLIKIGHQT